MNVLFNANARFVNFAMLLLRVGIGGSMIYYHGYSKITNHESWAKIGDSMGFLGVHFAPAFWGFLAAFAEFFGSSFLILGLFTRPAAFMLSFTMAVAAYVSYKGGEGFSNPLELLFIFLFFLIAGAGKYSLDARIGGFKK